METASRNIIDVFIKLIQALECPVCYEYVGTPIWQCEAGHILCNQCKRSIYSCPTCRCSFSSIRVRSLEYISDLMLFPCKNDGCEKMLPLMDIQYHENRCALASASVGPDPLAKAAILQYNILKYIEHDISPFFITVRQTRDQETQCDLGRRVKNVKDASTMTNPILNPAQGKMNSLSPSINTNQHHIIPVGTTNSVSRCSVEALPLNKKQPVFSNLVAVDLPPVDVVSSNDHLFSSGPRNRTFRNVGKNFLVKKHQKFENSANKNGESSNGQKIEKMSEVFCGLQGNFTHKKGSTSYDRRLQPIQSEFMKSTATPSGFNFSSFADKLLSHNAFQLLRGVASSHSAPKTASDPGEYTISPSGLNKTSSIEPNFCNAKIFHFQATNQIEPASSLSKQMTLQEKQAMIKRKRFNKFLPCKAYNSRKELMEFEENITSNSYVSSVVSSAGTSTNQFTTSASHSSSSSSIDVKSSFIFGDVSYDNSRTSLESVSQKLPPSLKDNVIKDNFQLNAYSMPSVIPLRVTTASSINENQLITPSSQTDVRSNIKSSSEASNRPISEVKCKSKSSQYYNLENSTESNACSTPSTNKCSLLSKDNSSGSEVQNSFLPLWSSENNNSLGEYPSGLINTKCFPLLSEIEGNLLSGSFTMNSTNLYQGSSGSLCKTTSVCKGAVSSHTFNKTNESSTKSSRPLAYSFSSTCCSPSLKISDSVTTNANIYNTSTEGSVSEDRKNSVSGIANTKYNNSPESNSGPLEKMSLLPQKVDIEQSFNRINAISNNVPANISNSFNTSTTFSMNYLFGKNNSELNAKPLISKENTKPLFYFTDTSLAHSPTSNVFSSSEVPRTQINFQSVSNIWNSMCFNRVGEKMQTTHTVNPDNISGPYTSKPFFSVAKHSDKAEQKTSLTSDANNASQALDLSCSPHLSSFKNICLPSVMVENSNACSGSEFFGSNCLKFASVIKAPEFQTSGKYTLQLENQSQPVSSAEQASEIFIKKRQAVDNYPESTEVLAPKNNFLVFNDINPSQSVSLTDTHTVINDSEVNFNSSRNLSVLPTNSKNYDSLMKSIAGTSAQGANTVANCSVSTEVLVPKHNFLVFNDVKPSQSWVPSVSLADTHTVTNDSDVNFNSSRDRSVFPTSSKNYGSLVKSMTVTSTPSAKTMFYFAKNNNKQILGTSSCATPTETSVQFDEDHTKDSGHQHSDTNESSKE